MLSIWTVKVNRVLKSEPGDYDAIERNERKNMPVLPEIPVPSLPPEEVRSKIDPIDE